ncbi:hypothetical protein V6N11_032379 [Hibiscus sabdariffa]|uniref:CCAAT-binding factor domain-containing protein n=1 Tax=Hibiscus sabdariffa TaxID=183260 RepID=A0ABR2T106_9ROSI
MRSGKRLSRGRNWGKIGAAGRERYNWQIGYHLLIENSTGNICRFKFQQPKPRTEPYSKSKESNNEFTHLEIAVLGTVIGKAALRMLGPWRYERFVKAVEEASRDMLPALKDKSLKTMYALLKSKPEQERKLLSSLVNKLGDPQNKGASADFYLSNLLSDHPNMKAVVIDEVDTFLFRHHLGPRAKYHAVNFLSQIRLSHEGDGPRVAKRLVEVYFALFKVLISEAGKSQQPDNESNKAVKNTHKSKENKRKGSGESHVELDSRLLSALLMAINRAFPYVSSNEADDIVDIETPILFQLVHSKNFNVGVQALMLLDKISSKNQVVSDRFYRALYSKLLLPAAMNSSKASEDDFFYSMQYDFDLMFPTFCNCVEHDCKAEMFIGLLLRAMKSDVNLKRVSAFSKRILQVALQQPPQYACGCLFLISEVLKARPQLWNTMLQNESVDEDLEHFEDIVEETVAEPSLASKKEEKDANELIIRETPKDFRVQEPKTISNQNASKPPKSTTKSFLPGGYDPRHREPSYSYSNADRASWWELMVLSTHVHPSVATMASTLLSGANIVYNGNPLNDLSLTTFLDKFMEKKPKASSWHGGSQIEPAKKVSFIFSLKVLLLRGFSPFVMISSLLEMQTIKEKGNGILVKRLQLLPLLVLKTMSIS